MVVNHHENTTKFWENIFWVTFSMRLHRNSKHLSIKINHSYRLIYIGLSPFPATVSTRIITFLVGDPYKPSFVTVTGRGEYPKYISVPWMVWKMVGFLLDDDKLLLLKTWWNSFPPSYENMVWPLGAQQKRGGRVRWSLLGLWFQRCVLELHPRSLT